MNKELYELIRAGVEYYKLKPQKMRSYMLMNLGTDTPKQIAQKGTNALANIYRLSDGSLYFSVEGSPKQAHQLALNVCFDEKLQEEMGLLIKNGSIIKVNK